MINDAPLDAPQPLTTLDGRKVTLNASINDPADVETALSLGAEGMFFSTSDMYKLKKPPAEDELFSIYSDLAGSAGRRPVTILLPDLEWHDMPGNEREPDPSLGCRGIRLALAYPEILKPHLAAVLRVGKSGNFRLSLPFVSHVNEVLQVKAMLQEIQAELQSDAKTFELPAVGLMVDLPAVIASFDIMAFEARFFNVGDQLIKYVLGADPENTMTASMLQYFNSAFLLQCRMLAENASRRKKKVGVCASLAQDPPALQVLIGFGFTEITVPTVCLQETKELIKKIRYNASRLISSKVISFWREEDARKYACEAMARTRI